MSQPEQRASLAALLEPFDQQHVLRFWDDLSPDQQRRLGEQIRAVDLELIARLYQGAADQPDWEALSRRAEPPPAVRTRPSGSAANLPGSKATPQAAEQRGAEALAAGEVGVLLVAGGQGSRLGFEQPKSLFPIGPISHATLIQIHIEKVRALSRRYGRPLPLYLMTSPVTHESTVEFLRQQHNFGLPDEDLLVFCQGTMPAIDATTGRLLLASKDSLFLSPDGHGGTVAALAASGAADDFQRRSLKHLFYFQVDNPLVPICDERLLGYHLLARSELTSIAVAKSTPQDKLGNFATIDGKMHVIEYSDFPEDVAGQRDADDELMFWAGSIAVHVFDAAFLRKSESIKESLPFHIAHKKATYIDSEGRPVNPAEPNALKFEKFIFDLLPQAARPLVVEFPEEDVFAPLKNAPGAEKDTPEYVQKMMLDQHRRWLEAAGAEVGDGIDVEISPLFGLDAKEVAEQVKPGQEFRESRYLTDEG